MNMSELTKVFNLYIGMNDSYHADRWLRKFATQVDYAKGSILILMTQTKQVEVDTLLECSEKAKEVSTAEPWIACLKEGLLIMLEAEKQQRLSLDNCKLLFSLCEKVEPNYNLVFFFNRWADKFLKRFSHPVFDDWYGAEVLPWGAKLHELEMIQFSNYSEIHANFSQFKDCTTFKMFPR